jgi:hypothetical protein
MTSSACSECGREVVVGMQHTANIRRRKVEWRECVRCYLRLESREDLLPKRGAK